MNIKYLEINRKITGLYLEKIDIEEN